MVEQLSVADKTDIINQLKRLTGEFGPAPLTNVDVYSLSESDIDIVAVGCLVMRTDRSTVLVRREETPTEWVIPGGTVDPGEDLRETAMREVQEETGLKTAVDKLLRVGLVQNYGPREFREVNKKRFGKEFINLLFVNFRAQELGGQLNCSDDPSENMLEVRAFKTVPFDAITHVYKVLFVHEKLHDADPDDYPAVEFESYPNRQN